MTSVPPELVREIRARLAMSEVVGKHVRLRRRGREFVAPCPFHNERTASFTVNDTKAFGHCFGCGWHGDVVSFAMRYAGLGFREAVAQLSSLAGITPASGGGWESVRPRLPQPSQVAQDQAKADSIEKAVRRHWSPATDWRGTLVEAYLREARGIRTDRLAGILPSIRFLPSCPYRHELVPGADGRRRFATLGTWPAMVALMLTPAKAVSAVHVTYLQPDGSGKARVPNPEFGPGEPEHLPAKKMHGAAWGAAIWLGLPADRMGWAEGVETGLSVASAVPELAIWITGSLGNMAGSGDPSAPMLPHPGKPGKMVPTPVPDPRRPGLLPPEGVREVLLLRDADGDRPTGDALIERACRRLRAAGRIPLVASPPDGQDFNDLLKVG